MTEVTFHDVWLSLRTPQVRAQIVQHFLLVMRSLPSTALLLTSWFRYSSGFNSGLDVGSGNTESGSHASPPNARPLSLDAPDADPGSRRPSAGPVGSTAAGSGAAREQRNDPSNTMKFNCPRLVIVEIMLQPDRCPSPGSRACDLGVRNSGPAAPVTAGPSHLPSEFRPFPSGSLSDRRISAPASDDCLGSCS